MTQNFRSFALLSLCGLSACTNLNAVDSAVGGVPGGDTRVRRDVKTRAVGS